MKLYLIYGGKSAEHEVSVKSAHSILKVIYYDHYSVIPVYITREGQWLKAPAINDLSGIPEFEHMNQTETKEAFNFLEMKEGESVAFPVLHGPNGEDGTVQGLFESLDIPYVGAGVLASAVGMDKIISKSIFKEAGLPVLPYEEVHLTDWKVYPEGVLSALENQLGFPMFVKPANLGSSVGITRVLDSAQLQDAVELAFEYDHRVVVEKGVKAREIEVAVLGNEDIHTSVPGELVKHKPFYDYEDKYLNQEVFRQVPSDIPEELATELRLLAAKAFHAIDGSGISRVDFFLTEEGDVYINEVNTFPGFTNNSMYPRVWAKTGLPYEDLIEEVIQLGVRRHKDRLVKSTRRNK
ncbi:D-alanine--D-alanine ligase [Alkalibacterium sp. AK22]|uniref:D-alanine--D-alanine ligase family protein n=1 Tax=Alkalibacterium sp. AK22 TaxID=1229520 RepID=UPI00044F8535|nr:D-alanine--D-alanine ligase family protein [Alkalibacterium sp. AK22]EXJ24038.1 D-alanine--D-alanine ligase [Alkalibacterium sp. AK22]